MNNKPLILVTNDDGIFAKGIRTLIDCVKDFGEVLVLAPDKPQSAMGHAVTILEPLFIRKISSSENYREYSCNGTPADCVKLAYRAILNRKPDLIVSGINHGANSSLNVLYSGTMAAVIEGAMSDIPAVGFSLCDYMPDANFDHCIDAVKSIVANVLEEKLPPRVVLNVNIPAASCGKIKGVKVTRQADAYWDERFDKRTDPHGREYYWLTGDFINIDEDDDNDLVALDNSYVSIVPVQLDLTAHETIKEIRKWKFEY
ncbi:MAG: 5'/3'-nucleotidase SurE [Bacteroidales bacterium]